MDNIVNLKNLEVWGIKLRLIILLSSSLLWKILAFPENLWVNIIKKKYLKEDDLFSYKVEANVSWQWGKLMG